MNPRGSNQEPGYKAVLLQESTKNRLQAFRRGLSDRDLNQERRLATAAVEMMLDMAEKDSAVRDAWLAQVKIVVRKDLDATCVGG